MSRGIAALASVVAGLAFAQEAGRPAQRVDSIPLAQPISTAGKITTLIFVSARCPISNDYISRMKSLYRDYSPRGVSFVFVNSNFDESQDEIEAHAKESEIPFRIWRDEQARAADLFGAGSTPEAYVIDKTGLIRYHGAIDDSRNDARVTRQSLRAALDSVLAGKPVEIAETKAFGCTIKRQRKAS